MEEWDDYDGVQNRHGRASHVRVASGVAVVPEVAFFECCNLRVLDLSNVATISTEAFCGCDSLERIIWTNASAVEIGDGAFWGCSNLREIDLHNVTKIGEEAFSHCEALERVTIPSSVAKIERCAFLGCNNLTNAELREGIRRIGTESFSNCSGLVRVNIPASVTDIEDEAFYGCRSLVEAELNEGLQCIREAAFKDTSLLRIDIPSSVTLIGRYAFEDCSQMRYAELHEGLKKIGDWAFSGCPMERITIPSSVTLVGKRAFLHCRKLSGVNLCEGIHCIDSGAFNNCPSLGHINIPPAAFVIDIQGGTCQLLSTTMPIPATAGRRLVASKWMQYRSPTQLEQVEAKVNEILGRPQQTEEEKIECIRKWSAYYDRMDVATLLELAIWRANMNGNVQANAGGLLASVVSYIFHGAKRQRVEARQASRRSVGRGMNVIIPGVLKYL